ncbi:MAG: addiction module component [Candidatus Brocadia sp. WS118]|nr:MAG: addiction module component [Candidatus Brocadia sp. WS118]
MSNSLEKMTKDVLSLPLKDRAKLAHKLITSLDEHVDSDINNAWETEINRRVRDIKNGIAKGKPAVQILSEIKAKYQ